MISGTGSARKTAVPSAHLGFCTIRKLTMRGPLLVDVLATGLVVLVLVVVGVAWVVFVPDVGSSVGSAVEVSISPGLAATVGEASATGASVVPAACVPVALQPVRERAPTRRTAAV